MTPEDSPIRMLRKRVELLDGSRLPTVMAGSDPRLVQFVSVMQSYTNTTMGPIGWAVISAREADAIVSASRLITDLASDEGTLVDGPLCRSRQEWIATGHQMTTDADIPSPTRARFTGADQACRTAPQPKPFGLGLYTSTTGRQGQSMWRTYLDLFRQSSLHPRPWYTWKLDVPEEVSMLEIACAGDWASFVEAYSRVAAGMLLPDWSEVSQHHDGVHVTARAVVATQGFSFRTRRGLTAPAFWDVEQTLWLNWIFASTILLDVAR